MATKIVFRKEKLYFGIRFLEEFFAFRNSFSGSYY